MTGQGSLQNPLQNKTEVRKAVRARLKEIDSTELQTKTHGLNSRLRDLLKNESGIWAAFQPIPPEPNLREALDDLKNIDWVFPRISCEYLSFHRIEEGLGMKAGQFGIMEPHLDSKEVPTDSIQGFLIPGLAFDRSGQRLGRGRGFYDRTLFGVDRPKIGIAFSEQVLNQSLPVETHDIAMDLVLTDSELIGSVSAQKRKSEMNDIVLGLVMAVVGLIAGSVGMMVFKKASDDKKKNSAEAEADRILNKARSDAQRIDRDSKQRAKDFEARAKKNAENEIQKQKQKQQQEEKALVDKSLKLDKELANKEGDLEQRLQEIASRDEKIKIAEKRMIELEQEAQRKQAELQSRIEAVSGLSANEAKKEMIEALTADVRTEAAKKAIEIEEAATAEAEEKARRVIAMAVARFAGEHTSERTVSVINLPNEEMKGKIIGREGRNIRALEAACGVDLIVDETPEAVVISSFDPVRREIARKALEKLMEDGRVHPARIEEVIEKVKKEIFKSMKEDGDKAVFELGLAGVHPEIVKVLGSLKYRQTLAQNVLAHSIEVGFLAGIMAAELGVDPKKARRAGLLHDIGKGLDHTIEGSHAVVGAEFLKKYGEAADICHAVRAHHDDEKPSSVLAFLVQAANVLSNSRPGARRQSMDGYIRRMEDMESIGNSFDGVVRTFAIQTGKELRVLVESSRVTDEQASMLSYDIARKIERELSYAGQVKVTVVREVRVVEHAR